MVRVPTYAGTRRPRLFLRHDRRAHLTLNSTELAVPGGVRRDTDHHSAEWGL